MKITINENYAITIVLENRDEASALYEILPDALDFSGETSKMLKELNTALWLYKRR